MVDTRYSPDKASIDNIKMLIRLAHADEEINSADAKKELSYLLSRGEMTLTELTRKYTLEDNQILEVGMDAMNTKTVQGKLARPGNKAENATEVKKAKKYTGYVPRQDQQQLMATLKAKIREQELRNHKVAYLTE